MSDTGFVDAVFEAFFFLLSLMVSFSIFILSPPVLS